MYNGFVMKRSRRPKIQKQTVLLAIVLLLLATAILYFEVYRPAIKEYQSRTPSPAPTATAVPKGTVTYGKYTVEFIDVGQADCILVSNGPDTMLIDAGNNEDGPKLVDYLGTTGIEDIDYLIGTHPHEDHIGGLDDIIESYRVGQLILPDKEANTKTYKDVIRAAEEKNLAVTHPWAGQTWKVGEAQCQVLSCQAEDTGDMNQWSVVIRMTVGDISFLFTGDQEKANEENILGAGYEVASTFYKAAHHGSRTANSGDFVNRVDPEYIIIQVGKDNSYGHPHREAMDVFENTEARIYRTDQSGTVIIVTDGTSCSISTCHTDTDG